MEKILIIYIEYIFKDIAHTLVQAVEIDEEYKNDLLSTNGVLETNS